LASLHPGGPGLAGRCTFDRVQDLPNSVHGIGLVDPLASGQRLFDVSWFTQS
jgi:hypothetical protein